MSKLELSNTEDSNDLDKHLGEVLNHVIRTYEHDNWETGDNDGYEVTDAIKDIRNYIQSNYILKSESDKMVDEAEKFNYDFGYKCGVNEITMSGYYILKSDVEKIIGEDYKPEMYDVLTGEYRSKKQLDRNRIGAFRNVTRLQQRNRLKESSK